MLIRNDILYFTVAELEACGISKDTVISGAKRYVKHWRMGKFQGLRHFSYDHMTLKYKKLVHAHYGDPKKYLRREALRNGLVWRTEDAAEIDAYRDSEGLQLSKAKRQEYKKAAALLALIDEVEREELYGAYGAEDPKRFWQMCYALIKNEGYALPASRRLKAKLKQYRKNGASVVVPSRYANNNARRLDQRALDILATLMMDLYGRKFKVKEVYRQFLALAKAHGLRYVLEPKPVTYAAVAKAVKEMKGEWERDRGGSKLYMNNRELVINQERASEPHLQWQMDGTPEALWYYDADRDTIDKLYVFKVIDSHSNAIVGYSVGKTETSHSVFEALKTACMLNGVMPHEIRSDKGSANTAYETQELFGNLGVNFLPTQAGRARAKFIEAWQNHMNTRVYTYFMNKSGCNITAKLQDSHQNPEKLKAYARQYPSREELVEQIALAMELWNELESPGDGRTPRERLADKAPRARKLEHYELIEHFMIWRRKGKSLVKYRFTNEGLSMTVKKHTYRYLPDSDNEMAVAEFLNRHMDLTEFYVKYDPSDMEHLAIYQLAAGMEEREENMRFVAYCKLKHAVKQSMMDTTPEDSKRLARLRRIQKAQHKVIERKNKEREERLREEDLLIGAVQFEDVYKDSWNRARLAVERRHALGYEAEILDDKAKRMSSMSAGGSGSKERIDAYDKDVEMDGKKDDDRLDVYG